MKGRVHMSYQNEKCQETPENIQPLGFSDEKDVSGKETDFYLSEDTKISDSRIIRSFADRIDYLRKNTFPGKIISLAELGRICNVTKQNMSNIVQAKNKSIDPKLCNTLACYFDCSAWYLLGICEHRKGIAVNGKEYSMPFYQFSSQSTINILDASKWNSIDPELYDLVRQAFLLAPPARRIICDMLKMTLKLCSA